MDLTQLLKYEEGKKLFHQKKIGEALKQFKEIVEYGDTNTYIYKIGCKFLKNKKYRKAANIFGMILNYKDAKKCVKMQN